MKNRPRLKTLKASPIYGGAFNMIRDLLAIFAVPGGNKTVQEGSKQWNARGLQPSIAILIAGVIVSGISIIGTVIYAIATREPAKREEVKIRGVNESEYKN